MSMMFCHGCGKEIHESANTCPYCGAVQRQTTSKDAAGAGKRKMIAGILALMFGGLGIHKFYTGAWGWGIVYIVLIWTWIPAIMGLVEGIRYLVLSDEEFKRKISELDGPFAFLW